MVKQISVRRDSFGIFRETYPNPNLGVSVGYEWVAEPTLPEFTLQRGSFDRVRQWPHDLAVELLGYTYYHSPQGEFLVQSLEAMPNGMPEDEMKRIVASYVKALHVIGFTVTVVQLSPPNQFGYRQMKLEVAELLKTHHDIAGDYTQWYKDCIAALYRHSEE